MKSATVIIGAAWGDEGKGLMTDYFAESKAALPVAVVRFNGGAQAGHTVETPDGLRHVFHHFSAGTFSEAITYLAEPFIVNPLLWFEEKANLEKILNEGRMPRIFADDTCRVTTPYDMLVNREIETGLGIGRHGSCGAGIFETVLRSEYSNDGFGLFVNDLSDEAKVRSSVNLIRKEWAPSRLKNPAQKFLDLCARDDLAEDFIKKCLAFNEYLDDDPLGLGYPVHLHYIFEGAQGLLLDETREDFFPYLTPSRTGLYNVIPIAKRLGIDHLDVVYVTRAYATRHGAGPLPHEGEIGPFYDITNNQNPWQGALRFAPLDLDLILSAIDDDLVEAQKHLTITWRLAITHIDQVDTERLPFYVNGSKHEGLHTMMGFLNCSVMLARGPTRLDISNSA